MTEAAGPPPRRRDAGATRQALLDAARELFDAHGFRGTTVRAIGERAGVDQALIARYFGGKAELYQAVLDRDHVQPADEGSEAPAPKRTSSSAISEAGLAALNRNPCTWLQPSARNQSS